MIYPDALQALMMQLPRPEAQRMVSIPPLTDDEKEALHHLAVTRMRARMASNHRLVDSCDQAAAKIVRRAA